MPRRMPKLVPGMRDPLYSAAVLHDQSRHVAVVEEESCQGEGYSVDVDIPVVARAPRQIHCVERRPTERQPEDVVRVEEKSLPRVMIHARASCSA
eukprot:scaffold7071_cov260-Pinguiococcus_pyrenoidosus.AAC.2